MPIALFVKFDGYTKDKTYTNNNPPSNPYLYVNTWKSI